MSEWRDVPLRDLCDSVQYGLTASASDEGADGPQLLRITDIVPPRIDWKAVPVCDASGTATNKYQLRSGDIVVARTGATVGHAKYLDHPPSRAVFASYLVRFQVGRGADPAYVGHIVQSAAYKQFVLAHAGGAAQPNANAKTLGAFPVPLPSLSTQRRIAALLSAFDELIEINERRIELLEDLARSLYREWFVRFRFPGHEAVEFVDSQLGRVPSGWPVKPTREVLNPIGGGTPSKKRSDFWEGGQIDWFTPSDLTKAETRYLAESQSRITALGLANSSARLFPAGSVLMTSRATLGVLGIAATEASCNQGFIVIPPVAGMPAEFIFEWLATQDGALESIATGATFKEITKTAFAGFPFLLPPREVLARFEEAIVPIGRQLGLFEETIRALATTRDLLLPRLVTGRLEISDIDLGELLPPEPA